MSPEKAATRAHRGLGRHRQRGELNVQLAYRERFRGYADHSIHCRAGDDWRGRSCLAVAGYCASERRATNMRGGKAARRGALCGPTGKLFPVRPVKQKSHTAEAALRKARVRVDTRDCTASGHVTAVPPTAAMNSRRMKKRSGLARRFSTAVPLSFYLACRHISTAVPPAAPGLEIINLSPLISIGRVC